MTTRTRLRALERAQAAKAADDQYKPWRTIYKHAGQFYDNEPWLDGSVVLTADQVNAIETTHRVIVIEYVDNWRVGEPLSGAAQ